MNDFSRGSHCCQAILESSIKKFAKELAALAERLFFHLQPMIHFIDRFQALSKWKSFL